VIASKVAALNRLPSSLFFIGMLVHIADLNVSFIRYGTLTFLDNNNANVDLPEARYPAIMIIYLFMLYSVV